MPERLTAVVDSQSDGHRGEAIHLTQGGLGESSDEISSGLILL